MKIRCNKRISFGLFAIEPDSQWLVRGIRYEDIPRKAIVRIEEFKENGMWAELPQAMIADDFEPIEVEEV